MVKHLPTMQETQVRSLGREDPLEKEMAAHSSVLAWRVPWTEEPGGLQSIGSQRVRQVKQDLSNYKSDKTEATEQPHSQSIQTVGCKIGLRMYYTTRGI